ncbi:zinc finger, RING/FYVE/PHD-type [Artemisia annua]|uniref:RING-type E3 ubiquitin transferase n=1 Tax=Artemisia annua TaxID=35608 RepID=A0A2U1Q3D3_ARTAN|nr:zinc finger, RING/FYVE/PHD-type [Artemisia annua]
MGHNGLGLSGLRVVGIESDSDTEELGRVDERNDDGNDESVGRTSLERFWDCPSFDNEERDREREEGLSSVIERIEEISISSLTSDGDATAEALEWEILLAVNNLERDMEIDFETDGGGEGFVYTPEFDTLIGQFVETVRALRGSPPAAKSIVDNLPLVEMKGDGNADDQVICAVCKDGILVEEKVMELPCRHLYHGECIVPWLSIRNTCPVCRFELPTDDVDYERSKNRVNEEEMGFELFT